LFKGMTDAIRGDYEPPRFTIGNCHISHFFFERVEANGRGTWIVRGLCDLEDASAGDSVTDLVDIELSMVPKWKTYAWRRPLLEGYGRSVSFEGYKLRLLSALLGAIRGWDPRIVPDLDWLNERWKPLIRARSWEQLNWFPVKDDGGRSRSSD
jgi:hypothetical protein